MISPSVHFGLTAKREDEPNSSSEAALSLLNGTNNSDSTNHKALSFAVNWGNNTTSCDASTACSSPQPPESPQKVEDSNSLSDSNNHKSLVLYELAVYKSPRDETFINIDNSIDDVEYTKKVAAKGYPDPNLIKVAYSESFGEDLKLDLIEKDFYNKKQKLQHTKLLIAEYIAGSQNIPKISDMPSKRAIAAPPTNNISDASTAVQHTAHFGASYIAKFESSYAAEGKIITDSKDTTTSRNPEDISSCDSLSESSTDSDSDGSQGNGDEGEVAFDMYIEDEDDEDEFLKRTVKQQKSKITKKFGKFITAASPKKDGGNLNTKSTDAPSSGSKNVGTNNDSSKINNPSGASLISSNTENTDKTEKISGTNILSNSEKEQRLNKKLTDSFQKFFDESNHHRQVVFEFSKIICKSERDATLLISQSKEKETHDVFLKKKIKLLKLLRHNKAILDASERAALEEKLAEVGGTDLESFAWQACENNIERVVIATSHQILPTDHLQYAGLTVVKDEDENSSSNRSSRIRKMKKNKSASNCQNGLAQNFVGESTAKKSSGDTNENCHNDVDESSVLDKRSTNANTNVISQNIMNANTINYQQLNSVDSYATIPDKSPPANGASAVSLVGIITSPPGPSNTNSANSFFFSSDANPSSPSKSEFITR